MVAPQIPDQLVSPIDGKGFVNIGSHPDNDVVIQGENVLPFHMMIDYRQAPYRLIPLSSDASIFLNNIPLSAYDSYVVQEADVLDGGGNRLRVRPGTEGAPPKLAISSPPTDTGFVSAGYVPPVAPQQKGTVEFPAGAKDKVIIASLEEATAVIDVEQTAYYKLTVINGSPLVSTFNVRVEGVPDGWVFIAPQNVNLYEGARAEISIEITPPRKPTSKAGVHPLRMVVTSLNHPGVQTVVEGSLEIHPFYDFAMGELSPQRKTIPFRHPHGEVKSNITNRGNSTTAFSVTAQDEEAGCRFQFTGSDGMKQAGTVEYRLAAGETQSLPVFISPLKKSIVGLRSRQFPYRVTVTQPENNGLAMFSMGTAVARPMIGILGIILILLITAATMVYLFTPRIQYFTARENLVGVGESTTLEWQTSFFTRKLSITGLEDPVTDVQGKKEVFPASTVNTYTLNASTWLWTMLGFERVTRSVSILSLPGEPSIRTFTVSEKEAMQGDSITLRWSVNNADKVALTINGVTEVFEDPATFNGERTLLLEKDTLIYLEATNTLGSVSRSEYVFAHPPTIIIEEFTLDQTSVYKGEQVTIKWRVSGTGMADGGAVTISPFSSVLPLEGELTFFPEASMEFVLTATNRQVQEVRILPVGVLEPEDPPVAPTIDFFVAAPKEITGPGSVELSWSVSGLVNNIKITNADETIFNNLPAQGFKTFNVSESGTYVLTATYADQTAGKDLQITVNPALITLDLTIEKVEHTGVLEVGGQITVTARLEAQPAGSPPPTGKIIVTDGGADCEISLPNYQCTITIETPGDKTISATYLGDDNYTSSEAEDWPTTITVIGYDIELTTVFSPTQPSGGYNYGQPVSLTVGLQGSNLSHIPDGELRIYKTVCSSTTPPICQDKLLGFHKLESSDSGVYVFSIPHLDEMGEIPIKLSFIKDSYYDPFVEELSVSVANTTKSPVSILAVADIDPEPSVGSVLEFAIEVIDNNAYGLYSFPEGTVSLVATHSDGVTQLSCNDIVLVEDAADTESRTSTASCNVLVNKAGRWTVTGEYKPSSEDIYHAYSTTIAPESTSPYFTNDPVTLNFNPTPSSTLIYGVTTAMGFNITSGTGTLTTGTLVFYIPSTSSTKAGDCAYDSGQSKWVCNVKPLTVGSSVDIRFVYTPPSGLYLGIGTKTETFAVVKADTTVSLVSPDLSNGLLYNTAYTLTVGIASASGGDAPADGTYDVLGGTGTCNSTGITGSASVTCSNLSVGTPCSVNFNNTSHVGSLFRFCMHYDGNSTTNGYNASTWTSSSPFYVKSDAISFTTSDFTFSASGSSSVSYSFTTTVSGVNNVNINPANVQIVDAANPSTVICPSPSGADFTCTRATTTSASPLTVTWNISASSYHTLSVIPVFTGDNFYYAKTGTGNAFTLTSVYEMSYTSGPSVTRTNVLTYASVEQESESVEDGEFQTNTFSGAFRMANFSDASNYVGIVQLIPETPSGDLSAVGLCTFTTAGIISCPSVTVSNSAITGFHFLLVPTIAARYDPDSLESSTVSVNVIENIVEGDADYNDITGYDLDVDDSCDANDKLVITITGYAPNKLEGSQALNPNDFVIHMECKYNAPNDDGDNEDTYSNLGTVGASTFTASTPTWTEISAGLWRFSFDMYTSDEGCGSYLAYYVNNVKLYVFHRKQPSYVPVLNPDWTTYVPTTATLSESDYEPFVQYFEFDEESGQKNRDFTCD